MFRTRFILVTAMFAALLLPAAQVLGAAPPSADDFLPPIKGGPTDVKAPADVKVEEDKVTAATVQDAINAAVRENRKELAQGDSREVGAKMVIFPSGMGVVASGIAAYRVMDNPTATRLSKRQAYVIAYTAAKKNLAEFLNGLSTEGKETIRTQLKAVVSEKETLANLSQETQESLKQATAMLLRGFVVYEVSDDTKVNNVMVSVVTTPKTRGKHARIAEGAIEAADLRGGLDEVIAEIRSGLVAPVGGRVIIVPATGVTAFVGFGSSIVVAHENSAVQAKLNLEAQKIAKMRAQDALCGIIIGDFTAWQGGVSEASKDAMKDFADAQSDDPIAKPDDEAATKLTRTQQTFSATIKSKDEYQSFRKGVLPPGITSKAWSSEDNGWSYAMAVYLPSVTNAATQSAKEMLESTLVQPIPDDGTHGRSGRSESSGFRDENNPNVPRPSKDVGQGATGKAKDGGL